MPKSPGTRSGVQEPSIGAPVERLIQLIGGRHKPAILIRLGKETHRFAEIWRAIPGLSERALARHLDDLERAGLVERRVYPEVPPRVEYRLTPQGRTLCPILKQMWKWGVAYAKGRGD